MNQSTNCEYCSNYEYDEEYGYYSCMINLDEDEMGKFLMGSHFHCSHFQFEDEYKLAKKQ